MPYDITDAFVEIKELQQAVNQLINDLQDKKVLDKPKKSEEK